MIFCLEEDFSNNVVVNINCYERFIQLQNTNKYDKQCRKDRRNDKNVEIEGNVESIIIVSVSEMELGSAKSGWVCDNRNSDVFVINQ